MCFRALNAIILVFCLAVVTMIVGAIGRFQCTVFVDENFSDVSAQAVFVLTGTAKFC